MAIKLGHREIWFLRMVKDVWLGKRSYTFRSMRHLRQIYPSTSSYNAAASAGGPRRAASASTRTTRT